jgi:GR25 family glycosyltransferase involved in LPS biosynthesis
MYRGFYINLDRSSGRRAALEARLTRLGVAPRYERFPAMDGNSIGLGASGLTNSELGCLLSHYMLLESCRDRGDHLHVVEDDVVFANCAVASVEQVIRSGLLDDYDILFTETAVEMDIHWCREARGLYKSLIKRAENGIASSVEFRIIPYLGCTTSYLVNRRSIGLVRGVLGEELDRGARYPVDILIRDAANEGKLRAKSLFPFVTSSQPEEFVSTTRPDDEARNSRLAMELLRHSFFVDCDLNAALDLAVQRLMIPDGDVHDRLHGLLAGFIGSDIFQRH